MHSWKGRAGDRAHRRELRLARPCHGRLASETGSASLEFLSSGLILLVPLVYLVIAMASVQGGAFAAEGAARQAARVYVQAPDATQARLRAERAISVALADYGLDPNDAEARIQCRPRPSECLTRGGTVAVSIVVHAPLPLVPDVLNLQSRASVALQASASEKVSRFWGAR